MAITGIDKNIKLTIVIVDDSPEEHFFIKKALKDFKNILFNDYYSGEDFLRFLEEKNKKPLAIKTFPDIVILDINMPKMTGFEVFDEIERRGLKKNIKFYVLTTDVTERDRIDCEKHDLACYKKPFNFENFRNVLQEMLKEYIES
jgi:CheY-like chemotaxis protein